MENLWRNQDIRFFAILPSVSDAIPGTYQQKNSMFASKFVLCCICLQRQRESLLLVIETIDFGKSDRMPGLSPF